MVDLSGERSRNGGLDRMPVPGLGGALWLCGKHLIGPDHEAVIEPTGASLVVCLNQRHELADRYPDYVTWLSSSDPRARWEPVHDLGAPTIERASRLATDLATHLAAGEDVVVHCGAGIGRAGTLAAAVLVLRGSPVDRAVEHVASCRIGAGPEAGEQRDLLDSLASTALLEG